MTTHPDGGLDAATERAEELAADGPRVVGPSMQAMIAAGALLWSALSITLVALGSAPVWPAVLALAGLALGVGGWSWARRHRLLQPMLPSGDPSPMSLLDRGHRRAAGRQWRGTAPLDPAMHRLMSAIVARQRIATRGAVPSLVALFSGLLGLSVAIRLPWLIALSVVVAVFVGIAGWVDTRRWGRLDAEIARVRRAGPDEDRS